MSANAKALLARGLLLGDLDPLDLGAPGSGAAEVDQDRDVLAGALEDRLDGTVAAVDRRSGDPELLGAPPDRVAKEHALHAAVGDHAAPHHGGLPTARSR